MVDEQGNVPYLYSPEYKELITFYINPQRGTD